MTNSLRVPIPWPQHLVEKLFYVKGRIGWRGLRHDEFTADGPYLITGIDIQDGRVDWPSCYHISRQKYDESPEIMVSPGDLVITKDGTIGKVALIEEILGPTSINSHLFLVRPLDPTNGVNSKFAYDVFSSFLFTKFVNQWMSGTTLSGLGEAKFLRFPFPVPPISEQLEISTILGALDNAIYKTGATGKKLRQIRAGLLQDLLTRGLDERGNFRDPVAHPEQFQDSLLGRIPRDWEVVRLASRAFIFGGKRLPNGHSYSELPTGFRYLRVMDFFERAIDFENLQHLKRETFNALARYEMKDGDLYISIAGSLGFCGVLRKPIADRIVLTENAARIEIRFGFVPEFLALQINGPLVQAQIAAEKGVGAGVPKFALFRLENLMVSVPPVDEQLLIVEAVAKCERLIKSEETSLAKLLVLKSGLMSDLLTGRVRVPEEIM